MLLRCLKFCLALWLVCCSSGLHAYLQVQPMVHSRQSQHLAIELFKNPFKTKWLFDVELLLRFKKIDTDYYKKVAEKVKEDLLVLNENKNGNKLIPYEPIDGKAFLVNTSKILNHRWIIAEFSNGDLWGQILVKYFVTEGKPTDFETVETVLYERPTKE